MEEGADDMGLMALGVMIAMEASGLREVVIHLEEPTRLDDQPFEVVHDEVTGVLTFRVLGTAAAA